MSELHWWLYDLVVISVVVLCVWNGLSNGIFRAVGGIAVSIISCVLAFFISEPVSEMVYDAFFQKQCQSIVYENLEKADITDDVRNVLEQNGIYLSVTDDEIADIIESVGEDDELAEQTAAIFGLTADELRDEIGTAVSDAVEKHKGLLPEWAENTITETEDKSLILDAAADTASAIFAEDRYEASEGLEELYIRPVVTSFLSVLVFVAAAFLIGLILRMLILIVPNSRGSVNSLLGGAAGLLKAAVYICLIVLLTSCIISMQSTDYPFFSEETVNRTYLFRVLYNVITELI
ncbi:MAG: hypothetical protein IJY74_05730 [Oscillospiraceae bacterium]|nr:hypothetical protein [Oscillospiraceae bacterium]